MVRMVMRPESYCAYIYSESAWRLIHFFSFSWYSNLTWTQLGISSVKGIYYYIDVYRQCCSLLSLQTLQWVTSRLQHQSAAGSFRTNMGDKASTIKSPQTLPQPPAQWVGFSHTLSTVQHHYEGLTSSGLVTFYRYEYFTVNDLICLQLT